MKHESESESGQLRGVVLIHMILQGICARISLAAVLTEMCDAKVTFEVTFEVIPSEFSKARSSPSVPLAGQRSARSAASIVCYSCVGHEL
jgi:hypothetical protein